MDARELNLTKTVGTKNISMFVRVSFRQRAPNFTEPSPTRADQYFQRQSFPAKLKHFAFEVFPFDDLRVEQREARRSKSGFFIIFFPKFDAARNDCIFFAIFGGFGVAILLFSGKSGAVRWHIFTRYAAPISWPQEPIRVLRYTGVYLPRNGEFRTGTAL